MELYTPEVTIKIYNHTLQQSKTFRAHKRYLTLYTKNAILNQQTLSFFLQPLIIITKHNENYHLS